MASEQATCPSGFGQDALLWMCLHPQLPASLSTHDSCSNLAILCLLYCRLSTHAATRDVSYSRSSLPALKDGFTRCAFIPCIPHFQDALSPISLPRQIYPLRPSSNITSHSPPETETGLEATALGSCHSKEEWAQPS